MLKIRTNQKTDIKGNTYNCLLSNLYYQTKDGKVLPAGNLKFYFAKDIGLIKLKGNIEKWFFRKMITNYYISKKLKTKKGKNVDKFIISWLWTNRTNLP